MMITGLVFPKIHGHPLYFVPSTVGYLCRLCRQRTRGSFRCQACNYDLCLRCINKNSVATSEGQIRSDSGVKVEKEISNWEYITKGLSFARRQTGLIIAALLFLLFTSICTLLLPDYQGHILDKVIQGNKEGFAHSLKLYLLISVLLGLFGGLRSLCFNLVGQKMLNDVQSTIFHTILMQDIAFFDGIATGDLTSRISSDSNQMISPINTVLTTFLSSTVSLIGGLIMCLYTSWRLSILAFTTIGPITLIYRSYSVWSKQVNREIRAAIGEANALATDAIQNIRTIRAFSREDKEEKKYRNVREGALQRGIKDSYVNAGTVALTSYIDQAIGVLILWYGGSVVMEGHGLLTVGKLITFQLYWNMINNSYNNLTGLVNSFTRAGGAAQRVMDLLNLTPDIDPFAGATITKVNGDVSMKEVSFHYQMRPDQEVLRGINLDIRAGQVCALVGRSGGGKSTLIHLLLRFYDPSSGKIYLDGKNLKDLSPVSFRKHIGIVAQETRLFNGTIEENIAYGVESYTQEQLDEASRLANAYDFIQTFDEGYQTRVGEQGTRLSGGQRQRIALARCFLKKPKILFLDEATSSLDAESEALVQEAIDKLIHMGNCTVILVAHRLSTVIHADIIAVVSEGKIAEQGTHVELIQKGGLYSKLVHRQIQKMHNTLEQEKIHMNSNTQMLLTT